MVRAIVFDCFGVLLTDALMAMVDEASKTNPKVKDQVHEVLVGVNRGKITRAESDEKISKILGQDKEEYLRRKFGGEVRNQPLLDYIEDLRKNYKTAILSNVSNGGLLKRFHVDELDKYFDETVASAEIGFAKPEAQAYEFVADRLGVRLDECVFTDDRQEYCDGAKAIGMQAILYTSFDQFKPALSKVLKE